jgi:signal transduction histidine kinase/ActR/RegA family two-component response regulator
MRVVAEAAADVSGSSTLAELEVVLRKAIGRVIDLDACTFGRYDAAMGVIRFVPGEADGVIIPASAWPIAGTPSERFLTERSSLVIHTSADPKGRGSHRIGSERMSESVIRCPMYSGEALLGLVAVHSYTPHRYTRDDVEVIEALAAVAASAIERMDSTQERHAAEDELQQSQEKLAQAQKMEAVGLLAGGIAHDFNNLLTAIKGNSDLMAGDDLLPDALRGHVDEIAAAAERAAALTRQLLAFSRKQVLQPRVLDLNVLVLDMSNLIRRLIGEDVTLVTSLETELCNVRADPHQMGQVILNLVLNGRDAMVAGGSLRIETCNVTGPVPGVLGPDTGDYVRLSVQDSGVGMNPESVERIFEPFFTTKGVGKGTGLGLSTVYGIVNQTGGHIHVISAPGAGTTMQVVLPRTTEPLDAPLAEDPGRHAHSPSPGQTTILVVEDEASVRSLLSRVLVREGFTVLEAADGDEAIALLRGDFDVDLMITDTVMPGMDGIALARHAAEIRPDIAVLHMSGYTEDEVFRRGLSSRGLDFLQKPFSPTALVAAVNDALAAGSVRTDAVE